MSQAPILVSACLLGQACRYDGGSKLHPALVAELGERALASCPEEAGGLGTPRPRAALVGGDGLALWRGEARVVDENGRDCTRAFQRGAVLALAHCLARGARSAILKERSPSCGTHEVWIEGSPRPGMGVTAALFQRAGLSAEARP
jgi:uncharacterized protein YbbK (DUF523 family)